MNNSYKILVLALLAHLLIVQLCLGQESSTATNTDSPATTGNKTCKGKGGRNNNNRASRSAELDLEKKLADIAAKVGKTAEEVRDKLEKVLQEQGTNIEDIKKQLQNGSIGVQKVMETVQKSIKP